MPGWREQYKRKSEASDRPIASGGGPGADLPGDVASRPDALTSGTMLLALV
jgi:hypothetical protein